MEDHERVKVSDYIVEFLVENGVQHVFGYPGGMVTHFMDSLSKYSPRIQSHLSYHEQAAAFEACAYAQAGGGLGAAYATSGPGATNLITGICHAYFDSVPVIFLTGQVNTFEARDKYNVRQRGFQETNIVDMVKNVTKYAAYIDSAEKLVYELHKACRLALSGRKGPVLLDIPMDVQKAFFLREKIGIRQKENGGKSRGGVKFLLKDRTLLFKEMHGASRPCLLLGAGVKSIPQERLLAFVESVNMPVVTSMIAVDRIPKEHPLNFGFLGAYGSRAANFIVAKSDLVLVLGSRMDVRQVGGERKNFAPGAKLIRVDFDPAELQYKVHEDEIAIRADATDVIRVLTEDYSVPEDKYRAWLDCCREIFTRLRGTDEQSGNRYVEALSRYIPENTVITADVGQNQVWVAQSCAVKWGQKILFSGGMGAMGYSLPAAIGAYYAEGRPVVSFHGDGGIQMNLQELEFIRREKLPVKVIVFNNYALGMIRHFQEMYFYKNYTQTVAGGGYSAPDFKKLAEAYDMVYFCYEDVSEITGDFMKTDESVLVEIKLREETYVFPKVEFGKPNQDQEPTLDRDLYRRLMEM